MFIEKQGMEELRSFFEMKYRWFFVLNVGVPWLKMSLESGKSSLSTPLRVETDEDHDRMKPSSYFPEDKEEYDRNDDEDSLGPLPPKWEKAYTESGEVYFIE